MDELLIENVDDGDTTGTTDKVKLMVKLVLEYEMGSGTSLEEVIEKLRQQLLAPHMVRWVVEQGRGKYTATMDYRIEGA